MNANERFEIIGELYHLRYRRLRPGKDDPLANSSDPDNVDEFRKWVTSSVAFDDAIEMIARLNERVEKLESATVKRATPNL